MTTLINRLMKVLGLMVPLAVLAIVGCGDEAPDPHAGHDHGEETQYQYQVKRISDAIMDSLRLKKHRYRVTRDEYWDDKGGVLENEFVEVWYPPGITTVTHGMHTLEQLYIARKKCQDFFGIAPITKLKIVCTPEMEDYERITKQQWWQYSKIEKRQITYQPIYILHQRHLGEIAIQHEYYVWAINRLSHGQAPLWMKEGLASYLSGEAKVLANQMTEVKDEKLEMTPEEVEKTLKVEKERLLSRIAYFHAYRMVETLIEKEGAHRISTLILRLGEDLSKEQAYQMAFDKTYDEIVAEAADYELGELIKPIEVK